MQKVIATSLLVLLTGFGFAQRKIDSKFGKGLYNVVAADSSWSMKFGMRVQSLYVGENVINETDGVMPGTSSFLIRRARLKFGGHIYSSKLKYKIELGLSNKDLGKADATTNQAPKMILDAVLKWNFYENFVLWAGQTKLPGNRERVVSSQKLQFVDRSLVNSRYNIDRDIGIQLRHKNKVGAKGVMKQMFSISIGEGRDIIVPNIGGYDYTARLEYLPFGEFASKGDYFSSDLSREATPKLAFGASYDLNKGASRQRGQLGRFMINGDGSIVTNDLSTVFVDAMFKYKGFSFLGEYANKVAAENKVAIREDLSTIKYLTGNGLNLQAGYLFKNNFEVAGRYTTVAPDDLDFSGVGEEKQYTLGFSKYIVGHSLKVQSDIVYADRLSNSNKLYYRFQVEVAF